ncbi:hypothetical protein [Alteromonas antoniana]|uniref:hypothetical protein n=1 Tax=Alteromonas antoniana TaxID=2803813 RepID=UPI001C48A3E5|nr:hypothetical protein [Alteromonas antoniana]
MTEQEYLTYLQDSVRKSYLNTQEGRPDDKHKYRTEGLIHAARLLGILSVAGITEMIEKEHQDVFGESVAERKARLATFEKLKEESIDDYFEVPAIQRKR